MSDGFALNNPKFRYLFVLIVVVVFLLFNLIHLRGGVNLSMDSLYYVLGAKNLAQGLGYTIQDYSSVSPTMQAITTWPIGYPAILTLGCIADTCTQESIEAFAHILNVVMAMTVFMLVYVTSRRNHGVVVSVLASMVVGLIPVFQIVFMYVWSETIFIPLVLAAFYYVRLYLSSDGHKHKLYAAIIFLICATYVRYVGLAFAIALILTVFLYDQVSITERLKKAVLSGVVYVIGIAPLLINNYVTSGYMSGAERGVPHSRFVSDIGQLFGIYSNEFFWGNSWLAFLFVGVLAAIVIYSNIIDRKADKGVSVLVNLPLLWFCLYVLFLLVSRELQVIDLDARMMSVVWPMLFYSVLGLLAVRNDGNTVVIKRLLVFVLFSLVLVSGVRTHGLLLKNVLANSEVGYVNGIYYPSVSGPQLRYLQLAMDSVPASCSEMVMTDSDRPVIINYFTECNKVVQLRDNKLDALVGELKGVRGWVVLTKRDNMLSVINDPRYSGNLFFVKNDNGKVVNVLIRKDATD